MQALYALLETAEGKGFAAGAIALATYFIHAFLKARKDGETTVAVTHPAILRATGAAISGSIDAATISADVKRIADACETIAIGVTSLAKSEEAGQARILTELVKKVEKIRPD